MNKPRTNIHIVLPKATSTLVARHVLPYFVAYKKREIASFLDNKLLDANAAKNELMVGLEDDTDAHAGVHGRIFCETYKRPTVKNFVLSPNLSTEVLDDDV